MYSHGRPQEHHRLRAAAERKRRAIESELQQQASAAPIIAAASSSAAAAETISWSQLGASDDPTTAALLSTSRNQPPQAFKSPLKNPTAAAIATATATAVHTGSDVIVRPVESLLQFPAGMPIQLFVDAFRSRMIDELSFPQPMDAARDALLRDQKPGACNLSGGMAKAVAAAALEACQRFAGTGVTPAASNSLAVPSHAGAAAQSSSTSPLPWMQTSASPPPAAAPPSAAPNRLPPSVAPSQQPQPYVNMQRMGSQQPQPPPPAPRQNSPSPFDNVNPWAPVAKPAMDVQRQAALRQAEETGRAPAKLITSYNENPRSSGPAHGNSHSGSLGRSWSMRDREPGFEDVEGDERAPRKKARAEDPDSPPAASASGTPFVSGNQKYAEDLAKKYGSRAQADAAMKRQREEAASAEASTTSKSLGGKARAKFTPPYRKPAGSEGPAESKEAKPASNPGSAISNAVTPMLAKALAGPNGVEGEVHEKLRGLDPKLVEAIMSEMLESPGVTWADIAGLEFAKKSVREIVVWPILKPELFQGLRGPPKGLLLFGPPGTGSGKRGESSGADCARRHGRDVQWF
jgi:hypothetical protein